MGSTSKSPLLTPLEMGSAKYCTTCVDEHQRPRVLGGSVPASRLAAVAAMSLGVVAVVAVVAGRQTRRSMMLATMESTVEASVESSDPALLGVDVVAYRYLDEGADPVFGTSDYTHTVESRDKTEAVFSTTFWFSSEANRDLFASDPAKYAPRYGGFCSYGITSEYASGADKSMDDADATEGWPWDRDHLGPPADLRVWTIQDDKLYFAFLPAVMDVFKASYDDLADKGERRWAEWFGDSDLAGPFNVQCMAESYGPPVVRTCTYVAQDSYPTLIPKKRAVDDGCNTDLVGACGDLQGNDPVQDNACSTCLDEHYDRLKVACPTADGALQAHVDKAFCW